MKKILAIVVTYNRLELLKECVDGILGQSYSDVDLLIVDNHSEQNTIDYLREIESRARIHVLYLDDNYGGAGGFYEGLKWAIHSPNYEAFWIMDDDTIASATALEELVRVADLLGDDYGFLSSSIKWVDGSPCYPNEPIIFNKRWLDDVDNTKDKHIIPLKAASFVSIMFSRQVVEEYGLPLREFFIWLDDFEYTTRITTDKVGYYCMDSVVVHKMAQNKSDTVLTAAEGRIARYEYLYRNKLFLSKKNYGIGKMWLDVLRNIILAFRCLLSSNKHQGKRFAAIMKGTLKGIVFNPKVEMS